MTTKEKPRTVDLDEEARDWLSGEIVEAAATADLELEPPPGSTPTGCHRKSR